MKKILFMTTACVFYALSAWASDPKIQLTAPQVTPVTPEAAAVQRYASYPMSHATGIPNISIPLYEIKCGDLTLPISLSYHASGFRPKEKSGWVGAGWTLNAEPSLMRTVQGLPDEIEDINCTTAMCKKGYFKNDGNYPTWEYIFRGRRDEEPDIYSYKLANGGGTAIPNRALMFLSFPLDNVKITQGGDNNIDFSITDENGVKYLMGGNSAYRETTGAAGDAKVTRWVCQTMKSAKTNAQITFTYNSYTDILELFKLTDNVVIEDSTEQPMYHINHSSLKRNYRINSNGTSSLVSTDNDYVSPDRYTDVHLQGKLVNKINFDNGYVTFDVNNTITGKCLDVIKVFDNNGNCLRRIAFYISKYNNTAEHTKLDSVVIVAPNCATCQNMVYRFDYLDPYGVAPMRTRAIDHWGFANAAFAVDDYSIMVPTIENVRIQRPVLTGIPVSAGVTTISVLSGRNRESDAEYAKKGMLHKITSPEGVETTFEYEGNYTIVEHYAHTANTTDLYNYQHYHIFGDRDTIPLGGLRIKKITERDTHTGARNFRNYTYGYIRQPSYEGISYIEYGGIPKRLITSNDYCFQQEMSNFTSNHYSLSNYIGFAGISRIRTWGSMPMTNITFNNGSAVLYGCVTERKSTHYAANNGMSDDVITKYYYSTPATYLQFDSYGVPRIYNWTDETKRANLTVPFERTNYEELKYGLLTKVEQFKDNGNTATLVSETNYRYSNQNHNATHASYHLREDGKQQAIKVYQTRICTPCKDEFNIEGSYTVPPGADRNDAFAKLEWNYPVLAFPLLKDSTTMYYDNGQQINTKTTYEYNSRLEHINPEKITKTNSDGVVQKEILSYERLMNTVLALRSYTQITGNDTVYSQMDYYPNNSQNKFRPEKVLYKTSKMSALEDKVKFLRYDAYGNPTEVWDYTGMTTCYLWGYNCQYPILKVENISYENLLAALSRNETWVKNLGELKYPYNNDELDGLIFMLQNNVDNYNMAVTNYQYKPLVGVTQMTDSRRQTTYFNYDGFGRLTNTYITDNSEKKKLSHNEYNLVGAYHGFFSAKFAKNHQENIYSFNVFRNFNVTVEGGSGNFKYDWELRYINEGHAMTDRATTTTPNVTFKPHKNTLPTGYSFWDSFLNMLREWASLLGPAFNIQDIGNGNDIPQINPLHCKITDIVTGAEIEISTWFYVDAQDSRYNH